MVSGSQLRIDAQRYRRLRMLGKGSFGEVFEAEDTLLGRRVAIKVLPFADRIPILARRALLAEAQMAAAAGRSAVQVFDLVEAEGGSWLVMEYISGGSLREWIKRDRSESELRALIDSLLDRLAVMHDLGLVHGDIHPGNLLVRAGDDVALSDFGLARMAAETSKKKRAHERHWSAPEVLESGRVSPAADVYSLALVIDWLYDQSGCRPPIANKSGLVEAPEDRPQDGGAFARLLVRKAATEPGPDVDETLEADLRAAADAARNGRTQAAMHILDGAIRRAPLDPRPRRRLALVRWTSGRRQAALWALESAQRLDPSDRLTSTMLLNWRDVLEDM